MPMFFAVFGSKKMRLVSQFTEMPPEAALTGLLSLSGGLFYLIFSCCKRNSQTVCKDKEVPLNGHGKS